MHTWGEILKEIVTATQSGRPKPFDEIRRRYLLELHQYTGRPVILYSSRFTAAGSVQFPPDLLSINDEDLHGLMEVMHGLAYRELDLILHSPGGSLEAAEAIVTYLRSKFKDVRVIVPHLALSAAAMISCSANRILMGKHSFLGPTDPQLILSTAMGQRMVSAEAILEQFGRAQEECKDPAKLGAWIPMLSQYGPDLIVKCEHACSMATSLVQGWLEKFMLDGVNGAQQKAAKIASWLSTHKNFKTHGRHIPRAELKRKGLLIEFLEKDKKLQDLVLGVFHATNHTFGGSQAVKIIENHRGAAFIRAVVQPVTLPAQVEQQQQPKLVPDPNVPSKNDGAKSGKRVVSPPAHPVAASQ